MYTYGYDAYGVYANPASQCFVEGTPVYAENGIVPIEDVTVGDLVWAWDEQSGEVELKEVVQTFTSYTYELVHIYVGEDEIVSTAEHPFYVEGRGWVSAIDLSPEDILWTIEGNTYSVSGVSVEYTTTAVVVYNFEVEDAHTYYVGSNALLVHNKCGGKRFTPDQEALIDIAKEIIRRKKPITKSDADILWKWVEEVGFDKYTKSFHSATYDSYQSGAVLHMKINSDHINIIAK